MSSLVRDLLASRRHLLRQVEGVRPHQVAQRPAEGEWSILEVLAHLIEVDRHYLAEAFAIHTDPSHVFVHFDDERWKAENRAVRKIPLGEILDHLAASHREVIEALSRLTEEDLQRAGLHPRRGRYSVRDVFLRFPTHDQNHAEQITSIRTRLAEEHPVNARRQ